jgi:amino acid permease
MSFSNTLLNIFVNFLIILLNYGSNYEAFNPKSSSIISIFLNYNPIPIRIADYTYDKLTAPFGRVNY